MTNQTNYNGDFYRQLSLLLKSGLPLPGSLRSLAAGFRSRAFRDTVEQVAASVDSGQKMSDAMRRFPQYFNPQYVEVIAASEDNGTLAEAIHEIGLSAQADRQVASLFRDIVFYPMMVIFVLIAIFLMLNYVVVYSFKDVFGDLLEGEPLPLITSLPVMTSTIIHDNVWTVGIIFLALVLAGFWLLSGSGSSTRILLGIVRYIPGFSGVFHELKDARLCIFWSMMLKRGIPEKKIFSLLELCTDDSATRYDLRRLGSDVAAGMATAKAIKSAASISPVIALTFQHLPEERIPGELENLSRMFLERSAAALRRLTVIGEVVLTVAVAVCVFLFIIGMFAPLIMIVEKLG